MSDELLIRSACEQCPWSCVLSGGCVQFVQCAQFSFCIAAPSTHTTAALRMTDRPVPQLEE